jgi:WD40 repeat protein
MHWVAFRSLALTCILLPAMARAGGPASVFVPQTGHADVSSGQEIRNFDTGHKHVRAIGFSPDGKAAVTQSNDGSAMLWETQTGRRLHILQEFVEAEEPAPCQGFGGSGTGQNAADDHTAAAAVAFAPDGKLVLAASDNSNVTIWETTTGKKVRLLEGHTGDVTSVVCSPDGRFVVSGSKDGTARLWRLSTGRELARLMSFDAGRAWAVVTPELLFDGSSNAVNYLAYRIPGSNRLASTAEMERCRRKELLRNLLRSE